MFPKWRAKTETDLAWSNFSAQDSEGYIYNGTLWADLDPIFDSGVIGAGLRPLPYDQPCCRMATTLSIW